MTSEESNFKRLFELSGDAMMVLDKKTFLHCNPATLRIFECPSVELFCTKHPADLSPPFQPCGGRSKKLAVQHIRDALSRGSKRFDWVHQRLNGELFHADVLLSAGYWQGESVIQAIIRDVSEYKSLQLSLQQEKELSERATKAKAEFLAVMSHEIRTPIHGILGAQELLMETRLDAEQRELAALAIDSTRVLLGIVNDVLDFSKIDAGKLVIEQIEFNAGELVSAVFELFNVMADETSIRFKLNRDHGDVLVVGDPYRIQQILNNLLSNAMKFTHPGGSVTLGSTLAKSAAGNDYVWQLAVKDSGIGMSEEQQSVVFDVFTQADSSISRSYGGTGLGLSICKALAELMGGGITLTSQLGMGTTFSVELPLAPAQPRVAKPMVPDDNRARDYQMSVLVAEDNLTNQVIIEKKLARLGLQAVVVGDGLEAIRAYEKSLDAEGESYFSAILMDVQMPELNGVEATRELRARGCTLPILALTADVQVERRDQCLQAGMQAFIGKPYEEAKLVALFDRYLTEPSA